jgi:hypothetical protein
LTWLLNREEKEQYVIQLYKEGRSVREIAKQMHMSFRDIGAITKRLKSEVEREKGYLEENDDIISKSKTTQAIKLFSEGKNTVDVVIALDLRADEVQAIYREYWELNNMYELAEVYEEIRSYLPSFLRLHRILNDRGMGEQEILNVLELANNHQLQHLQWKVEYLRNDIEMLEDQKTKASNHILILNRRIDEFQGMLSMYESSLPHKREEMAFMNQGSIRYDNTDNLYPITYSEPTSLYSTAYAPMNDSCFYWTTYTSMEGY